MGLRGEARRSCGGYPAARMLSTLSAAAWSADLASVEPVSAASNSVHIPFSTSRSFGMEPEALHGRGDHVQDALLERVVW